MSVATLARPGTADLQHAQAENPLVKAFFDEATFTVSYVVWDSTSSRAAVIDPVLDFDPASGRTATDSADQILMFSENNGLEIDLILETHVHADHLTGASYLREQTGAEIAIGANITVVQGIFGDLFNAGQEFKRDGSQFDILLKDGDEFTIGNIRATAMHTPGHTPNCMVYVVGDAAFVGDTLFMPDYGTARCDFPRGDAGMLFRSIQKIFSLPGETRLFMCHDYKAPGRDEYAWETTVAKQRAKNVHVHDGVSEHEFVDMRSARDSLLEMPRLILPSVQVNMRAGEMPPAETNGVSYLKIPVNAV